MNSSVFWIHINYYRIFFSEWNSPCRNLFKAITTWPFFQSYGNLSRVTRNLGTKTYPEFVNIDPSKKNKIISKHKKIPKDFTRIKKSTNRNFYRFIDIFLALLLCVNQCSRFLQYGQIFSYFYYIAKYWNSGRIKLLVLNVRAIHSQVNPLSSTVPDLAQCFLFF